MHATDPSHSDVYSCKERKACTLHASDLRLMNGDPMPDCSNCAIRNVVVIREPVGTHLATIISECGVQRPAQCPCAAMENQMNLWGIDGCQQNRQGIVAHLASAASGISWLDGAKIVARGYLSAESMLDEAIKRAAA